MTLYLIVIYVGDLEDNKVFYEKLGFKLTEEKNDDAPIHYSLRFNHTVFEFYPAQDDQIPTYIRLGFELSQEQAHEAQAFVESQSEVTPIGNSMYYAVLSDPDGRNVEIIYSQP